MQDGAVSDPHPSPLSPDALGSALRDIVEFVDGGGWGQPPMLFALVPTTTLIQTHPDLLDASDDSELSPVAEEPLAADITDDGLIEVLATTSWPPMVAGAALIREIVVLPPGVDPRAAQRHPESRAARLVVGALRDGPTLALLHLRPEPGEAADGLELRTRTDLAAELRAALAHTLD